MGISDFKLNVKRNQNGIRVEKESPNSISVYYKGSVVASWNSNTAYISTCGYQTYTTYLILRRILTLLKLNPDDLTFRRSTIRYKHMRLTYLTLYLNEGQDNSTNYESDYASNQERLAVASWLRPF
jgi:hypothetical protein